MTKKVEKLNSKELEDKFICRMIEFDSLHRVIFESQVKVQKLRKEIDDLINKIRLRRLTEEVCDGTNGEKK